MVALQFILLFVFQVLVLLFCGLSIIIICSIFFNLDIAIFAFVGLIRNPLWDGGRGTKKKKGVTCHM